MIICHYCGRLGSCGPSRPCTSPEHPANVARTRAEARESRRRQKAEAIAAQHFPWDGSDADTIFEARRRAVAAILQGVEDIDRA